MFMPGIFYVILADKCYITLKFSRTLINYS